MGYVMDSMIVFRIATEHIGVDIVQVREVVESSDLVKVPKSPAFILGLVNIRGNVIPVVSLRKRLGLGGIEGSNTLLITESRGRVAALKVDELFGTKKVDASRISDQTELRTTKDKKELFLGIYEEETKPIHILNLDKILSKEDT